MVTLIDKSISDRFIRHGCLGIPPVGLTSLAQGFEETSLCDLPRTGAPHLSEVRISDVASQMDTLSEQSTTAVSSAEK